MITTNTQVDGKTKLDFLGLPELIEGICDDDMNFEQLDAAIRDLEEKIFDLDALEETKRNRICDSIPEETKKILNDRYCEWETILEARFAQRILNLEVTDYKEYPLYDRFRNLISKELHLLEPGSYQSILFIGSGPFPITAILLHQFTGKKIDCLERDAEAVQVSRNVLKALGLDKQIQVHYGRGETFDFGGYDVILNALLAKPKWSIMKNIRNRCSTSVKVLCRTSHGLRRLLYETTASNALHGFRTLGMQRAGYNDTISTLYLVSKDELLNKISLEWVSRLTPADKAGLRKLMNGIIESDTHNGFLGPVTEDDLYFKVLENDLALGLKYLLVIRSQEGIVGQMVLNRSYIDTYSHRAEVSTLMIDKSVRGKSVSLQVVQALTQKCEQLAIRYITLDVRAGTRVSLLWKYLSFEPYGQLPCYAQAGEEKYAGIFMYKDVESLKVMLDKRLKRLYNQRDTEETAEF
jgi:hypothetical protein